MSDRAEIDFDVLCVHYLWPRNSRYPKQREYGRRLTLRLGGFAFVMVGSAFLSAGGSDNDEYRQDLDRSNRVGPNV